jgi:hypothetical protein
MDLWSSLLYFLLQIGFLFLLLIEDIDDFVPVLLCDQFLALLSKLFCDFSSSLHKPFEGLLDCSP